PALGGPRTRGLRRGAGCARRQVRGCAVAHEDRGAPPEHPARTRRSLAGTPSKGETSGRGRSERPVDTPADRRGTRGPGETGRASGAARGSGGRALDRSGSVPRLVSWLTPR